MFQPAVNEYIFLSVGGIFTTKYEDIWSKLIIDTCTGSNLHNMLDAFCLSKTKQGRSNHKSEKA